MNKTLRILGISVALLALLVFSTVVVSDFDCQSSADDAHCPYCHLTHQAPAEPEISHVVSVELIAVLAVPKDSGPAEVPAWSETAPRAPPA